MSKEENLTGAQVVALTREYLSPEDVAFVQKALIYAIDRHSGQFRKSGEPYIIHPIQVAGILAKLKLDAVTVACGFLHDVVEDTVVSLDNLEREFSKEVRLIVDGVTKLGKVEYKSHEEQLAENHRKMLMAMSQDMRVILVKLADRLHNMRTLKHLRKDKQERISRETMDIYAPLAHRLGISSVKWELEDLSFRYLNEVEFYKITHLMKEKRREREALVDEVVAKITKYAAERNLDGQIYGRPKHIYSIYRKMQDKKKRFEEIYDLIAIRCILETPSEVYAMLGYVHELWRPMPGRFKDYIANPKANGYQSIHTTVYGPKGPIEFQIRTQEMHEVAEYGVAAHWAYKKGIKGKVDSKESAIGMNWISEMMDLQEQSGDAKEFVDTVKQDFLAEEIYVFTPDGAVRALPKDSVPIDFAYEIHTKVGEKATGAKVNGRMVPLTTKLKTGDQVEIITSANSFGPSRDWINIVKTSKARNRIRQFFKNQDKALSIDKGRELLVEQFQQHDMQANQFLDKKHLDVYLEKSSYKSEEALYAAIGFGEASAISVFNRLTEKERREIEREKARAQAEELLQGGEIKSDKPANTKSRQEEGVSVKGAPGLLIRMAKCCNPVPGDAIVGYITKGRGVAVHREDCMNLRSQENYEQRLLDVEWESTGSGHKEYTANIDIYGLNRTGLLNDVLQVLSNSTKNISMFNAQPSKDMKFATIHVSFGISSLANLTTVVDRIKNVPDVYSVKRTNG
ncbi:MULTISPECIES: bifunctional (p)ppGpp synthetase/guanosine-3',5'-bis(diphosphate) 3'-pyrophosphohydrolase [unclassified Streptococcus]|uniref:RelA/SpoT family protein n=1 Tax=unclassified Streptococcus TaxID=2608887 RepID=UPI0018ABF471|nr:MULTISPECIES: bifunctional (p)ppGpp synthetase/guanosine-3',5'-bis(diphosphate) 3'-pyrophosphohydrolase [unclassified Streptococcus]MBF8970248.1 bifunctional (p)ppGpp synthetase/guanosine-3',5'-bis(diphosphate) 3'-pyrophosphohydrolase [Streptococcus sp. NLN76]MBG9366852.1 bifunctional (p)ppGpp synthetase/guanosine-3',5'-bis(diphosphate) 3'-pyrophosphohydrolase [Streptococcus sp. NLN64]MBJ6746487.1 bifunctional (p)ppGpp synthetase/guanosine-3',5'-bis(diphosphate) 3'-pyrophosphohydrolase [Strep